MASLSSFASLLAFTAVNVALIVLRYREPEQERPFRVPLSIAGFPILPGLAALSSVLLASQFDAQVYLISGIILAIGLAFYFVRKVWR